MSEKNINHQNNFDLIRLLAAIQVLFVHCDEHLKLGIGWIKWLELFPGVPIFFVISGFLVSASYERSNSLYLYATNRILRIYPGLWVCFLASLVSVFLIYQPLIIASEFLYWVAAQLSIAQFYNPDFLRGYGIGVLNGSLWTIPVEIQFYALTPIIYFLFEKLKWKKWILAAIFFCFILINQGYQTLNTGHQDIRVKLIGVSALPYLYMFMLGIFLQRYWASLGQCLKKNIFILLILYIAIALIFSELGIPVAGNKINPISSTLLGCITVCLAHKMPGIAKKLLNGNDISYGIYIYHMPIINAFIHLEKISYIFFFAILFLSIFFATLSWLFVEKPALKLKNIFATRSAIEART